MAATKTPNPPVALRRRVFVREQCELTGWSRTWINHKIAVGLWPANRRDPGTRRLWLWSDEVEKALAKLNAKAVAQTTPTPHEQAEGATL
jgi:hypothetical protein